MPNRYKDQAIKVPRFKESEGFYTTPQRSKQMARIRGKDTKPEIIFRRELHRAGIRYRVNFKGLPGKPDISNKLKKFVVFIDGEFWHGHNWHEKKKKIRSNREFWIPKIERNIQRDQQNTMQLKEMGYRVFRFWEHEIKKDLHLCIRKVVTYVKSS